MLPTFSSGSFWLKASYLVVIFGVAAWAIVLNRNELEDKRTRQEASEHERDELRKTLDLVTGHLGQSRTNPTPLSVDNLSQLPSNEMRRRVQELVSGMRTFEAGIEAIQDRISGERFAGGVTTTEEQRQAAWTESNRRDSEARQNARSEFEARFRPMALALREEMCRRLGFFPPFPPDHHAVALDYGMLAGVHPIGEAAAYLERLARGLPA